MDSGDRQGRQTLPGPPMAELGKVGSWRSPTWQRAVWAAAWVLLALGVAALLATYVLDCGFSMGGSTTWSFGGWYFVSTPCDSRQERAMLAVLVGLARARPYLAALVVGLGIALIPRAVCGRRQRLDRA